MTLAPRSHFVAAVRHAPSLTSQRSYSRRTALQIAIQHGDTYPYTDTALAEYLRSVGAHMTIHDAAFFGDVAVVQQCLLANPACINEKRLCVPPHAAHVHHAARLPLRRLTSFLHSYNRSTLCVAARNGHLELVRWLVGAGAELNSRSL